MRYEGAVTEDNYLYWLLWGPEEQRRMRSFFDQDDAIQWAEMSDIDTYQIFYGELVEHVGYLNNDGRGEA